MSLSTSLRQRAGALIGPAERFIERWVPADARSWTMGPEGLIALCRALQTFAYLADVGEEEDRQFVEGAGALLGVLLIEHIQGAEHACQGSAHRVRLGAHGFFDPFAAVDRVLDASDIRRALRNEVELAEAEARAAGPLSRVVTALATLLAQERPDLAIDSQFDATLSLRDRQRGETFQLDLKRAVETTRDQDGHAAERVVRRLVSLLPGAPDQPRLDGAELAARVLPRLARADAVRDLSSQGQSVLFTRELCEGLVVALLLAYEGRARYLRADELNDTGIDAEEAYQLALRNLRACSERARIVREPLGSGYAFVARSGDGRDSARVLLPELYEELAARIGPTIALALPHRDTFFACDAACPVSVENMAQRAREDSARAPHALSDRLYRLTSEGLR